MARICNQALLGQLPQGFSWRRNWSDPDLEGVFDVKIIELPDSSVPHAAKPKLFHLSDVRSATRWKRTRLVLRGTDIQFREPEPPFTLTSMYVLNLGHEVQRVGENNDQCLRIVIAADKVEVLMRKQPASMVPTVSPRGHSPRPKPTSSPRQIPSPEKDAFSGSSSFGSTPLSTSPQFDRFGSSNSISSAAAFVQPPLPGPSDSLDDWFMALHLAPAVGHVRHLVEMCDRIKFELFSALETVRGKDFQHIAARHTALLRARQLVSPLGDPILRDKLSAIVDPCLIALADIETSQESHIVSVLSYVSPAPVVRSISPRTLKSPERRVAPPKNEAADASFVSYLQSIIDTFPLASGVEKRNAHISLLPLSLFVSPLSSLVRLVLSQNSLSSVPTEIGELRSLEFLDLSGNFLVTLPQEIGNLKLLRVLLLSNNSIESLPIGITLLPDSVNVEGLQALRYRISLRLITEQLDYLPRPLNPSAARACVVPCLCGAPIPLSSPPAAAFVQTQSWRNREHLFWAPACRKEDHIPNVYSILHQVSGDQRRGSDKDLKGPLSEALRTLKTGRGQGSGGGTPMGSSTPPVTMSRGSSSGSGSILAPTANQSV